MLTLSHYLTGCFPITKDCNIGKLSGQTQEEQNLYATDWDLLKYEYFNLNFSDINSFLFLFLEVIVLPLLIPLSFCKSSTPQYHIYFYEQTLEHSYCKRVE